MLTKEKIDDLVNCRLPEDVACHYLRSVSEEALTVPIMSLIIASVQDTALPQSAQLFADFDSLLDCSGTGGSGIPHYNTSTTVAFVLAAAGINVTKFGNRAANSLSGSFDLLDHLGIGATLPESALPSLLQKTNLAFLFAPQFYPALAGLAPIRKAVGCRTIFNLIGPLLNPARPVLRLLGTPGRMAQDLISQYLSQSSELKRALVVNAESGLDEIDPLANNRLITIAAGRLAISEYQSQLPAHGRQAKPLTVADNVGIFHALMGGQLQPGNFYHTLVCLNAGAALAVAGTATDSAKGFEIAQGLIASGAARAKYEQYRRVYASHTC